MGVIAAIVLAGALVSITSPAAGQQAETLDPAALSGPIDPASIIDVGSFSARAEAWAAARADHQESALARAVALAAETKAAEEAEGARLEAEEARRAQEEEARRAAEAAAAATTTTTSTTTTTAAPPSDTVADGEVSGELGGTPPSGGPTAAQWHALRQCESGNNYTSVSSSGRYRGAYQFSMPTWDWLAGARYPELVGVDPIDASPADQDKMAHALYDVYGKSPWPVCGQHLP